MPGEPRSLLVYAWDGKSPPFSPVTMDVAPEFDVLLFDFSGRATAPAGVTMLSARTECKGDIYHEVFRWLATASTQYEYIGLLDDDIEASWSDMNRLLAIARAHRLDSFSASLSHDSVCKHNQFLHQPGSEVRPVKWVEVMMPFYRQALFMAGGAYFAKSISSYGLDQLAMYTLQKLTGMDRVAVVDAVVFAHRRPITSDGKVFRNGLNAEQERNLIRRMAMAQVRAERPDLVWSLWYFKTFSVWLGAVRYQLKLLKQRNR